MWNNDIKEKIKKTLSYTAKRDCIITLITCIVVSIVIGAFIVYLRRDEDKTIKVGVVYVGDASTMYTNNFIEAFSDIEQEYNGKVEIVSMYNVAEGTERDYLERLVSDGCNMIFSTSYNYGVTTKELAQKYPEVQFCMATCSNANEEPYLKNYHTFMGAIYQGRYAAGVAAGMKLKELIDDGIISESEAKIGYVGAYPYAEVISGYTAFLLGARSVVPQAVMTVKYTNSWNDPTIESQVAKALIDRGCDVISQHSDSTAPATTAEDNGVWQVGYNNDMIAAAPNASLVSPRIDWGIYVTEAVQAVIDGKEIPADWCKGYADGAVYLSPLNEKIAAEGTQEAIDKAAEALKNGELFVFGGPLKGVSPDGEKIEVAEGDHFPEQEEASAPSWQYIIEGCNVVQ